VAIPLPQDAGQTPNPWLMEQTLVFLGFELQWTERIADLEMNTRLAESWETDFLTWEMDDREVILANAELGYYVDLEDGLASFRVESEQALVRAMTHIRQLARTLEEADREGREMTAEAQYLKAVEDESRDSLVQRLSRRVLNRSFDESLGMSITDFAYLADFEWQGRHVQLSIGALNEDEVADRVASIKARENPPKISVFSSVTFGATGDPSHEECERVLLDLIECGQAVARELQV